MFRAIWNFTHQDQGQDIAEYCLIIALVMLVAVGIILHVSGGVQGMWDTANTTLVAGNSNSGVGGMTQAGTTGNQAH